MKAKWYLHEQTFTVVPLGLPTMTGGGPAIVEVWFGCSSNHLIFSTSLWHIFWAGNLVMVSVEVTAGWQCSSPSFLNLIEHSLPQTESVQWTARQTSGAPFTQKLEATAENKHRGYLYRKPDRTRAVSTELAIKPRMTVEREKLPQSWSGQILALDTCHFWIPGEPVWAR